MTTRGPRISQLYGPLPALTTRTASDAFHLPPLSQSDKEGSVSFLDYHLYDGSSASRRYTLMSPGETFVRGDVTSTERLSILTSTTAIKLSNGSTYTTGQQLIEATSFVE
jgi:hypothetical protein